MSLFESKNWHIPLQSSVLSFVFAHAHALLVHVALVSPLALQSVSIVHVAKEEKKYQSVLKATWIHNGKNCFNLFQISIVLNTNALSGSSKQEAWRIRKTIGSKEQALSQYGRNCFNLFQISIVLNTTDNRPWSVQRFRKAMGISRTHICWLTSSQKLSKIKQKHDISIKNEKKLNIYGLAKNVWFLTLFQNFWHIGVGFGSGQIFTQWAFLNQKTDTYHCNQVCYHLYLCMRMHCWYMLH